MTSKYLTRTWLGCSTRSQHAALRMANLGLSLVTFGAIVVGLGLFAGFYIRRGIREGIIDNADLTDQSSEAYKAWQDNHDNPAYFSVYVYNLENPSEVLELGAAPAFNEMGPFVYRDLKTKFNVNYTDGGDLVRFQTLQRYEFDRARSVADDSTVFRSFNLPFQSVVGNSYGTQAGDALFSLYRQLLGDDASILFVERSVREMLFGYDDPILSFLHQVDPNIDARYPGLNINMSDTSQAYPPDTMYSGKHLAHFRQFYKYREQRSLIRCVPPPGPCANPLPLWATTNASMVSGGDGTQTTPNLHRGDSIHVFRPDAFRSVRYVNRDGKTGTVKGISTLRFVLDEDEMKSAKLVPRNKDFNQLEINGFFNVTAAALNLPLFLSEAHMLGVDKNITDRVHVSRIQELKHDSYLQIEPISGATMELHTRTQFNLYVRPLPDIPTGEGNNVTTWFPNLKPAYVPIMWFLETGFISDKDAKTFRDKVYLARSLEKKSLYLAVPLGGVIFLGGVLMVFYAQYRYVELGKQIISDSKRSYYGSEARSLRHSAPSLSVKGSTSSLLGSPGYGAGYGGSGKHAAAHSASYGATTDNGSASVRRRADLQEPVDISYPSTHE